MEGELIELPKIGFGTWKLAEGDEALQAVHAALRVGYRLIDTARIYGNEASIGRAVKESDIPRDEIIVTTKLWPNDLGYESAETALHESLNRLDLEYIDLYLIHWPGSDSDRRLEAWRKLIELREQGLIRHIGVSNFSIEQIEALQRGGMSPPAVNQIELHPFNFQAQKALLEYCQRHSIVVEAYSPLGGGAAVSHPLITAIAEEIGKTPAQVLLRWAIQIGSIPIPKSATRRRIIENYQSQDFELTNSQMERLATLS